MKDKKKIIIVNNDDKLLNILKNNFPDFSGKTIKHYISHKMVLVDNRVVVNSSTIINKGSKICIYFEKKVIPSYNLKIIYEDNDLIAINKPAGLLSISNNKEKNITAFRLVSDYLKEKNKYAKLFVVHRLDQDTSGVLLFAKNINIKTKLQDNWNDLVKLREYICVCSGYLNERGTIKSYLTSNHAQIVHSTKNKEIGKLSITNYETIKKGNNNSLLRVCIDTGRRNQIRVHLSENGHPIIGDKKYGTKDNSIKRLALHASKLELIDPRSGKLLKLYSKEPMIFKSLVETKKQ